MISFRYTPTATFVLAFVLSSTSCVSEQPAEIGADDHRESNCALNINSVDDSIRMQLVRLKETTSVGEAELLGEELGKAYEANPCQFVHHATHVRLTDEQIANIIRILPVEFVDSPCESEKKLQQRLQLLNKTQLSAERLYPIRRSLQSSADRDKKMCSMQ